MSPIHIPQICQSKFIWLLQNKQKNNFIKVSIALYQLELLGKFPYILECDYHLQIRYLRAGANKQNWLWIIGLMFSAQILKLKMYLCLFSYSEVRCDSDFNSIQLLTEVRNQLYNIKLISPLFDKRKIVHIRLI